MDGTIGYYSSFVTNCTFTDPTLSFVGVDTYIRNVGNLVPVVNWLLLDSEQISSSSSSNNDSNINMWPGDSKSDLLSISLNKDEQYIETRWNMIGTFNKLLWKPRIDVIGRTKFWYREVVVDDTASSKEEDGDDVHNIENGKEKKEKEKKVYYQVYFYDEMWEVPAGLALMQLITTAGTIANTTATHTSITTTGTIANTTSTNVLEGGQSTKMILRAINE